MKKLIQWQSYFSVQVAELDEQHKRLIEIINELYNAYLNSLQQEKISYILKELYEYTNVHFKTEENYFHKFEYNESVGHIAEHMVFLEKIKTFEGGYTKNSKFLSLQIMNFLQEWLSNHIMKSDKRYVEHFKVKGLK
jgi:hemerythrin